jgi:membrane protease YdiL (CAAX protease family)
VRRGVVEPSVELRPLLPVPLALFGPTPCRSAPLWPLHVKPRRASFCGVRVRLGSDLFSRRLEQRDAPRSSAWIALAYGGLGALGATLSAASGHAAVTTDAWLGEAGPLAAVVSLALGALVAIATVRTTRILGRAEWARALHADLRPLTYGLGNGPIFVMALASGVGEELFFRGWLTPLVGVLLSSLVFGLLHQVRGRARWAWAGWATVMGLVFATIYELTGHLAGPVLAHVSINFANLRYLRDHDPDAKPQALGGLLSRR